MFNNFITYVQGVSTMNYFKDMVSEGPIKFFSCVGTGILTWFVGSLTPIWLPVIILGLLIFTDAFLGCKISLKNGKKCESRRLWKTLRKLGWCCATVWFANQIDRNILVSFDAHLVELFAGLFGGVELWSMVENLNTLYPDGPWKILSKVIKAKGEKYLDITIDKEDLPKVKKLCKKIK